MRDRRICVAGYLTNGVCIRPVFRFGEITEDWLHLDDKRVIRPFSVVELDLTERRRSPPHTEDWIIDPDYRVLLGRLTLDEQVRFLSRIEDKNVRSIFGAAIHFEPGFYILSGEGRRSLGTIAPKELERVFFKEKTGPDGVTVSGKYDFRLAFRDQLDERYFLAVVDLAFRTYLNHLHIERKVLCHDAAEHLTKILRRTRLFLRIGLARGWEKFPDRCYLQITGVYSFPDYLGEIGERTVADFRQRYPAEYRTSDGRFVRSKGEKIVADWFYNQNIRYEYERKIAEAHMCDFYLPDTDTYVEYWGKDDEVYRRYRENKEKFYSEEGLKLISLDEEDLKHIDDVLMSKLGKGIRALEKLNLRSTPLPSVPTQTSDAEQGQRYIQRKKPAVYLTRDSRRIREVIMQCADSISGQLSRTGIARILVGSMSKRVTRWRDHPLYGKLRGRKRSELMREIDELIEEGHLSFDNDRNLITSSQQANDSRLPRSLRAQNRIVHIVRLGEIGSSSAVPELIVALDDTNGNARRLAASALGKIRDKTAVRPLISLLRREKKPQVRQYAIKALGQIGDPQARSTLEQIASNNAERYYVQASAHEALRKISRQTGS